MKHAISVGEFLLAVLIEVGIDFQLCHDICKVNKISLRSVFAEVSVILCLGVVQEVMIHSICLYHCGGLFQDTLPITKDLYTNGVGLYMALNCEASLIFVAACCMAVLHRYGHFGG
jgi:hypothetical protein